MRVLLATVLSVATAAAITTPARAEVNQVLACTAIAPANGQSNCTFVAEVGTHWFELTSTAAYATATVTCQAATDPMYLTVSGGGYRYTTGRLVGPLCTLGVTATSGGSATGHVYRTGN